MNFALLLSTLPHLDEARGHYNSMLALHERTPGRFATRLLALRKRLSHYFA